jgi:hypothetical protein
MLGQNHFAESNQQVLTFLHKQFAVQCTGGVALTHYQKSFKKILKPSLEKGRWFNMELDSKELLHIALILYNVGKTADWLTCDHSVHPVLHIWSNSQQ